MKKRPLVSGEDPEGVVSFWCKKCGLKRYKERKFRPGKNDEPVEAICEWLDCSCRCECECHRRSNWNNHKCICKPCYPCGLLKETSKTAPIASCGNRRICFFAQSGCKKRDVCSYQHFDDVDDVVKEKDGKKTKLEWT